MSLSEIVKKEKPNEKAKKEAIDYNERYGVNDKINEV